MFEVSDAAIDVYADPARRLGTIDAVDREMHVGLGCAIENLTIAARVRGLDPVVTLLPDGPESSFVAHVALSRAVAEQSELYESIGDRHTNRGPYTAEVIPADVLDGLVDTTGLPGVTVEWVTDPTATAFLGQLMIDAATAITNDDQQSRDGFAWFRSNDDSIQRHRDGLTLDEQGLSPVMLTVAKLIPASSRTSGDNSGSIRHATCTPRRPLPTASSPPPTHTTPPRNFSVAGSSSAPTSPPPDKESPYNT